MLFYLEGRVSPKSQHLKLFRKLSTMNLQVLFSIFILTFFSSPWWKMSFVTSSAWRINSAAAFNWSQKIRKCQNKKLTVAIFCHFTALWHLLFLYSFFSPPLQIVLSDRPRLCCCCSFHLLKSIVGNVVGNYSLRLRQLGQIMSNLYSRIVVAGSSLSSAI